MAPISFTFKDFIIQICSVLNDSRTEYRIEVTAIAKEDSMDSVLRRTAVLPEHLGEIATEALLRILTNYNPYFSSIDWIRESVPQGFTVTAEFERKVYDETEEGKAEAIADLQARLKPDDPSSVQPAGKLVRIVLEANGT